MTPEQIRAAIAASPDLQALQADGNVDAIARALSVGRTKPESRLISARGLAAGLAGGPLAAEAVLLKLEGARDLMLASADQQQRVIGSLLRRQLGFLSGEGLDFGSPALRGMLDQFAAMSPPILTSGEVDALKALALVPDPIAREQVTEAIYG